MAGDQTQGASDPIVASLVDVLDSRYPGRFSADQTERVHRQLHQLLDAAGKLRRYPLTNGDEPAPVYRAYQPEA